MPVSKRDRLVADGYELFTVVEAGIPHFVWRCDLDIIHDRNLHLSEETILRLIDVGLKDRETLSQAMGLDSSVLRNGLLNLLERHAIEYDSDRVLRLSTIGKRMLLNAKARVSSTEEGVLVRHDPYRDELRWHRPEYDLTNRQMKAAGRRKIVGIRPVDKTRLEERFRDIQDLIARSGLPSDKARTPGKREVLRVHAVNVHEIYRPVDLEVWFKRESHEFNWRVTREDVEETEVMSVLEQLEAEGAQIIPTEPAPADHAIPEANESLHEVAEAITRKVEPSLLRTNALREVIRKAAQDAYKVLFIISPWLNRGAIDAEMTHWFEQALSKKPDLRIVIGYGIERLPTQPQTPKDRRAHDALRHLRSLGNKYDNRIILTEIGNTHEKIMVVDDKYGIIGSFNWLSFHPKFSQGTGVRREIGYRITDPDAVKDLLKHVRDTLQEAEARRPRS